ncbi:MAG: DUF3107 domain-containing protein [Propionibacteriaceae bacterium]|nr:DUF3107 domain-containing protein [Propionibacteriaceae bacterium]
MEIKIGIKHVARELTLETACTADEVEKAVSKALADKSVFTIDDENGRRIIIPISHLAYLELGQENARKVGFGAF